MEDVREATKQLTALEARVLVAWRDTSDESDGLHFKAIAERVKVEKRLIRRVVRALARKGYVEFRRGMWTEDGEMYGSGYAIRAPGLALLDQIP